MRTLLLFCAVSICDSQHGGDTLPARGYGLCSFYTEASLGGLAPPAHFASLPRPGNDNLQASRQRHPRGNYVEGARCLATG